MPTRSMTATWQRTLKDGSGAGPLIQKIEFQCEAEVPGVGEAEFQESAAKAKEGRPVSKSLAAVPEVTLIARMLG